MTRHVDPARRCLATEEWPEANRRLWQTALDPRAWGRVIRRSPATHLKPASLEKYAEGYGRWLGFLADRGLLDPAEAPERRVILGISAQVYREHYDRGGREVAARRFVTSLEAERRATAGYARRIFETRRQGDLFESVDEESRAP